MPLDPLMLRLLGYENATLFYNLFEAMEVDKTQNQGRRTAHCVLYARHPRKMDLIMVRVLFSQSGNFENILSQFLVKFREIN